MNNSLNLTGDVNQANFTNTLAHFNSLVAKTDEIMLKNLDNVDSIFAQVSSAITNLSDASLGAKQSVNILKKDLQAMHLSDKLDTIVGSLQQTIAAYETSAHTLTTKIEDLNLDASLEGFNNAAKGIETVAKRADLMLYRSQEDFGLAVVRLKESADNLADFSRQIRETPSLLLRSEEKQGRVR